MKEISPPKRFIGLHAHSTYSVGDGIGRPEEHIDFARKNGMDALALTDHGNMNGFSSQYLYAEKLQKQGIDFKPIFGVESYFIPSLKDWQELRSQIQNQNKNEKKKKSSEKGNSEGITVEDESESKGKKIINPLYKRNHLVLLAKNRRGLKSLFECVSYSYIDGFYKYPRVDFSLLEKHAKGNIIASTACIAGPLARIVFDNQITEEEFDLWVPNDDNFEKIQKEMAEMVGRFQEIFGPENFYLECQFGKFGVQHLVNMHIVECADRMNIPLITTCDSHYSDPGHWKEREIYKLMARLSFYKGKEELPDIPKSIDEIRYELYPKNAEQVWQSYLDTKGDYDFYDDNIIKESIERTDDIAHNQIDDIVFDKKVKLPRLRRMISKERLGKIYEEKGKEIDEDEIAFAELKKKAIEGAIWRKITDKEEYIERLRMELEVVKHLKFAKYFLTYHKIMKVIGEQCLTGVARGSAASSILAYVLDITQVDPIKHGLLFERFLTKTKKCLDPDTYVKTSRGTLKLNEIQIGDYVMTHTNKAQQVSYRDEEVHNELYEIELENGTKFRCSPLHKWVVLRDGKKIECKTKDMLEEDELIEV